MHAAEYYHKGRSWCDGPCGCCRSLTTVSDRAAYVGGLDSDGAPHGLGAWHDTHKHGELLVGCVLHSPHSLLSFCELFSVTCPEKQVWLLATVVVTPEKVLENKIQREHSSHQAIVSYPMRSRVNPTSA